MQTDKWTAMKKQKRLEWGDKPCDHPNRVQEHYLGSGTGDYACTQCGRDVEFDAKGNPIPS